MRCNWFTKASCISRTFTSSEVPSRAAIRPSFLLRSRAACISPNFSFRISPAQKYASSLAFDTRPLTTLETPSSYHDDTPASGIELTPAQMSREAWKSTRLALREGDVTTALIIGEAVRLSHKPSNSAPSRHLLSSALEFPVPVPRGLSSHALLHGLLRLGNIRRAHVIANILMENGVRIHGKTLERIIEQLVASDGNTRARSREFFIHLKSLLLQPGVLTLQPSSSASGGTSTAIRLLQAARNYKQYRSERMFRTVINSCLLHGELIAATLLFTAIVRDCALKEALGRQLHSPAVSEDPLVQSRTYEQFKHLRTTSSFFPPSVLFRKIVRSIAKTLSMDPEDPQDEAYTLSFRAALQALANLAVLLDFRQLPYNELAHLIRLLYSCPKVDDHVWIIKRNGVSAHVKAYDYFHDVLGDLILLPPSYRRDPHLSMIIGPRLPQWSPRYSLSFPLDLDSCNALLHYSLRHRLSPMLANRVLTYMKESRSDPCAPIKLEPDVATYNILLSAGRILRSPSIAENALEILRSQATAVEEATEPPQGPSTNSQDLIPTIHSRPTAPKRTPNFDGSRSKNDYKFSRALRQLAKKAVSVPSTSSSVRLDRHTLTSYITYLVATGRPHLVADLLFELLPELSIVDHPAWGSLSPEERRSLRRYSRTESIKRAVGYGPYFFVAILNAVVKAGRTGLAERVWHLAKEAERASWLPAFNEQGRPWCLPVHAYTLMIKCYGREALKPSQVDLTSEQASWNPQSNRYVIGWAGFILRQSKMSARLQRPLAGRESAVLLYSSMFSAARLVYEALHGLQKPSTPLPRGIEIPRPDARFFNAMVDIITHYAGMRPRRARTTPSHWRQHIRFAKFLYARFGKTHKHLNPYVQAVAEDITNAGFPLPLGLRYLLLGRDPDWQRQNRYFGPLPRGPWAYPQAIKQRKIPFSLVTEKQKGLPLGRTFALKKGRKAKKPTSLVEKKRKRRSLDRTLRAKRAKKRRKIRLDSCIRSNGNG